MRRRQFITLLGGAAVASPFAARAQPPTMPVIGVLRADTPSSGATVVAAFRKGLSETGFVEGRNLAIEFRWAQNHRDRLSELASDLIRRQVKVIAAPLNAVGALVAKGLTTTVPIVFSTSGDPVQLGLVASLSRPGGNVTGFSDMGSELVPKQLGLLHELLPGAVRFGVIVTRGYASVDRVTKDAQTVAAAIGRQVEIIFVSTVLDIDAAFSELVQRRVEAFVVPDDVVLASRQTQILTLAARHALPAIYANRAWVDTGGLMSYGALLNSGAARSASIPGAFSRARNPPTCRWPRRPSSNSSSTSLPPGRSG
jgi:putative ABC transport system substrate-binding protein